MSSSPDKDKNIEKSNNSKELISSFLSSDRVCVTDGDKRTRDDIDGSMSVLNEDNVSSEFDESSDDSTYEVERILNDRVVEGKRQFKIKWLGYSMKDCTWEFEENVFCKNLIEDYEALRLKKLTRQRIGTNNDSEIIKENGDFKTLNNCKPLISKDLSVKKPKGAKNHKKDVNQKIDNKKIKKEEFDNNNKSNKRRITNEWEDKIKKIMNIVKNEKDNIYEIQYETVENKIGICNLEEFYYKAPLILLKYYEKKLVFNSD